MTKQCTVVDFHAQLTEAVKKPLHETRHHQTCAVDKGAHQGDVYLIRIAKRPAAWTTEVSETRQVAVGQGEGSHYRANGALQVYWPKSTEAAVEHCPVKHLGFLDRLGNAAGQCLGPVIVAKERWELTHPKHANHSLPAGTYLVTYRRTMRRVQD
jgi:hypothetical protein